MNGVEKLKGDRIGRACTRPNGGDDIGRYRLDGLTHYMLSDSVDFGASVIRVDRKQSPSLMDNLTRWACTACYPFYALVYAKNRQIEAYYFTYAQNSCVASHVSHVIHICRHKRSLAVDLHHPKGVNVVRKLCHTVHLNYFGIY